MLEVLDKIVIFRIVMKNFRPSRLQDPNVFDFSFDGIYSSLHNFGKVILSNQREIEILYETAILAYTSVSIFFEDASNHFALLLQVQRLVPMV